MAGVVVGLLLGLGNPAYLRLELMYLAAGIVVFYVGFVLERGARPR